MAAKLFIGLGMAGKRNFKYSSSQWLLLYSDYCHGPIFSYDQGAQKS